MRVNVVIDPYTFPCIWKRSEKRQFSGTVKTVPYIVWGTANINMHKNTKRQEPVLPDKFPSRRK